MNDLNPNDLIELLMTTITTDDRGRILYKLNGEYHRVGGPAIETADGGYVAWFSYGKLHRIDGPAVIYTSDECWWVDDHFDEKHWYLNGIRYTEKEYHIRTKGLKKYDYVCKHSS